MQIFKKKIVCFTSFEDENCFNRIIYNLGLCKVLFFYLFDYPWIKKSSFV